MNRGDFLNPNNQIFGQDSWLTSYKDCEALGREIMASIAQRSQEPKNSVAASKASAHARKCMTQYYANIKNLSDSLFRSKHTLTDGEFERRQHLIDSLTNKKVQMEEAFNCTEEGGSRRALMGPDLGLPSSNPWDIEEDERTRDLTFQEIKEQQQMAIKEQDRGLDTLYDVVIRQKQMAQNIGQEIDVQNEIIDDIVDHADHTRDHLLKETRHVAIIDRKSGTCGYWVTIVLLLVTIIVIAVIPV